MIAILSPSKTQDLTQPLPDLSYTEPALLSEAKLLLAQLQQQSADDLAKLMSISDSLAALNHERYQRFSFPFTTSNARPALFAFQGDVYTDIAVHDYQAADFDFAQQHLRILSGFYGLLRPLDLIQAYRLEMKTRLHTPRGPGLYKFWGDLITKQLNLMLREHDQPVVVNLASQEYFKAVDTRQLNGRVITPEFKEYKNGQLKTIAVYAKRARGKMANFIVTRRISDPQQIKIFNEGNYEYDELLSSENKWIFAR